MHFRYIPLLAAALLAPGAAQAHDYRLNQLHIEHPYARSTVPGQQSGAAYLAIENQGQRADKLIAITSPLAKSVEIHTMSMDGNIMKMREVQDIELKPSARIAMHPGDGYHIMLIGLNRPLKAGEHFPLTLIFEKSGKTEVSVLVEEPAAQTGKAAAAQPGR